MINVGAAWPVWGTVCLNTAFLVTMSTTVSQVTVPEPRMRGYGGRGGEEEEEVVECEVRGRREEVERAVALLQESIAQSELSRRRQALAKRQHLRKPAVSRGGREGGREGEGEREGRREGGKEGRRGKEGGRVGERESK